MDDNKPINTPVKCGAKLSKYDKRERINLTLFKSLVGSLPYLKCKRLDIDVRLITRYRKTPTTTDIKIVKRILRYIKVIINFSLINLLFNDFKLVEYNNNDWV